MKNYILKVSHGERDAIDCNGCDINNIRPRLIAEGKLRGNLVRSNQEDSSDRRLLNSIELIQDVPQ